MSGECADNSGGTEAVIYSCNGTGAQIWTVNDDGTIHTHDGLCAELSGGATASRTKVALGSCTGASTQQWAVGPGGSWVTAVATASSQYCLTDPSNTTAGLTQLDIAACSGATGQKWSLPAATVPQAPASVTVTADADAATVAWTPETGGGDPVTGYVVTASPGSETALPEAVTDTNSSGSTTADYIYGQPGTLANMTTPSGTDTAVSDWEGSVTGLVNSSGSQVTTTAYSDYGTSSTAGTTIPSIGYAGSYTLPGGSGIDDMRARDYNPTASEFLSVDPEQALTGQPYAYVSDSPVAGTDPSGRIEWGLCGSGLVEGAAAAFGSACLVVTLNPFTGEVQFGVTLTGGGGLGMFGAGAGVGIQTSNANQVSDLGGWFGTAGGSASVGADISWGGFTGIGACNQQIIGGDSGIGVGVDLDPNIFPMWEIHGGATYTGQSTFFSFNINNLASKAGSGMYKALMWALG